MELEERAEQVLKRFEENVTESDKVRKRDRADRATSEQVLDPKTRLVLFKLLSTGVLDDLGGCISTGKEANVYSATGPNGDARAVKVYKTAILVFKDRYRYVEGDYRFRAQTSSSSSHLRKNSRKMVQVWAEKEFRNLARLQDAGVHAPKPFLLRSPVLVMSFFGEAGWPAPRLKDVAASMSIRRLEKAYSEVALNMWRMYYIARLVHGDLSEYNLLVWEGKIVVIDVSQSVDHDHPHAFEFLRRDCVNVNSFFQRHGVNRCLSLKGLFDFVTKRRDVIDEGRVAQELAEEMDRTEEMDGPDNASVDEEVFRQAFIPRSLHEVVDHERDMESLTAGITQELYYTKITGLDVATKENESGSETDEEADSTPCDMSDSSGDAGEDASGDESSSSSEDECIANDSRGGLSKKEWKRKVKAENAERRKSKMPKKEKKRREALAKRRRAGKRH
eukprot:Plantae.Rhodophyta-Rhodochaete_pulchella.ctg287.p1 GENE.Plantae.Rhodophyta-Rhodochaete_pulchella.ctg287~~Plantae.Rhodophyta-Rhodochaete_pulchella.ctg287.p1  ORF type:complete len:468 (-),score=87.09 Plantae.Rhodophyta-Rhodochaete_pulchella.ctg287:990-2333(-)